LSTDTTDISTVEESPASVWLATLVAFYTSENPNIRVSGFLSHLPDDALIELYARAETEKDLVAAPLEWAARATAIEIEHRLHSRRLERGDLDAAIEIPHPLAEVKLEPQFGPYAFDEVQAVEAARALPEDEAARLVRIIPAHRVPARLIAAEDVPERIELGPVVAWKAALKRFAGSDVAKLIERSFWRKRLADRVVIRPRKVAK
jgi:hypothetical protein